MELTSFPYAAQPILCTPRGNMWLRVEYEIVGGKICSERAIGEARPLESHSFTYGDYVLSDPTPFMNHDRLLVLPGHRIVAPESLRHLLLLLVRGAGKLASSEFFSYWFNAHAVLVDYRQHQKADRGSDARLGDSLT